MHQKVAYNFFNLLSNKRVINARLTATVTVSGIITIETWLLMIFRTVSKNPRAENTRSNAVKASRKHSFFVLSGD